MGLKKRFLTVRNQLIQLYKAPRNFFRAAALQADRVNPTTAPSANGRPVKFQSSSHIRTFYHLNFWLSLNYTKVILYQF